MSFIDRGGIPTDNTIEYRGYTGSIGFSSEDARYFGKVMKIRALVSYEGETIQALIDDFHGAVDDYLEMCAAEGIEP